MSGLLADFPHYFLVVPGIQSDAQFLLVVILECHWSLIVCCCQSLVVVVRSQNWTWGPGAAWSSHLVLNLVLDLGRVNTGKRKIKRIVKKECYTFLLVGWICLMSSGWVSIWSQYRRTQTH